MPERILYTQSLINRQNLDSQVQTEMGAIDEAILAMQEDTSFERAFNQRGQSLDDVLHAVASLDDFFASVLINTQEAMLEDRRIQDWGRRILTAATVGITDRENGNREISQRLLVFVQNERSFFQIEI